MCIRDRGIPADRLAKLRKAMKDIQGFKTYKRLIKAIGEITDHIDGAEYEKMRPQQDKAYKELVKSLAGN